MNGMIFDVEHGSFVDGPGIRTTVFLKGCNLRCVWCHNPESQIREPQLMIFQDKCIGCGKCAAVCPSGFQKCILCGKCGLYCPKNARKISGREVSVQEVMDEILMDQPFFQGMNGGVTFSGGEAMLQVDFLLELLKKCKEVPIHTAVDTAGCVPFDSFEKILPYTDLFLYDVKAMDPVLHKKWTGADNTLILENLARLLSITKQISVPQIWIRIPIIPGVNDTKEELTALREFLDRYGWPQRTELLPYHAMGENKYRALAREPMVFAVPSKKRMTELNALLTRQDS